MIKQNCFSSFNYCCLMLNASLNLRHGCLLKHHYNIEISVMLIEFQIFH